MEENRKNLLKLIIFGGDPAPEDLDVLEAIYNITRPRYVLFLAGVRRKLGLPGPTPDPNTGLEPIPENLDYILTEVIIKRYNRRSSEGFKSESVEGHQVTYDDTDFLEYEKEVESYYGADEEDPDNRPGRIWIY